MPRPRATQPLVWLLAFAWSLLLSLPNLAQPPQPSPYTDSPQIPDTPAYTRAREVMDLLNKADAATFLHYVQESFAPQLRDAIPTEQHAAVYNEVVSRSGKLTLHSARSYTPALPDTHAALIVRTGLSEQWLGIVLDVEDKPPHKITGLSFNRARTPSDVPKGEHLTDARIAQELGAYAERLVKQDAFSGTVLLAKDGTTLLSLGVGQANRDFKAPNTIDTKFNLGSMNKMFTAVAILQLAEQGKLSLDDTLAKHLDSSWLSQDILERVKVRHLLSHTAGLGSYFNEIFWRTSRAQFRAVSDYKPLVSGETLAFEPGADQRYSNTGFLIAGAVVEKAGGGDYFDYIRRHVTGPAGMTGTDCYELDRVNDNLAVGYERRSGPGGTEYFNNIFAHVIRGGPAGGGYSTVTDLLRFDQALRAGKLLKKESLAAAWTPVEAPHSFNYGLGFSVEQTPAGRVVGHGGDFAGISAQLSMYLDSGHTVAILSNYDSAAPLVADKARELIVQGRQGKHLLVHTGDYIHAGDALTEGPLIPHDILNIKGEEDLYVYMLEEVQNVYRAQGVPLSDKHIEIILRQMLGKVRVLAPGDTDLLPNEVVDRFQFRERNDQNANLVRITESGDTTLGVGALVTKEEFREANAVAESDGKHSAKARKTKPATARTLLLGITKASLQAESFLSGASFQETTKVLTEAALRGAIDDLKGLKENVLLGHLIPAGTGFDPYQKMKVKRMAEPPVTEDEEEEAMLAEAAETAEALGAERVGTMVEVVAQSEAEEPVES